MKTKKLLALLLALCMVVSLCACGKPAQQDSTDTPNTTPSTPNANESTVESNASDLGSQTTTADSESVQRSEIKVGVSADAANWSPFAFTGSSEQAIYLIAEPLGYYIDGEYIPVIMKSYSWSEDGTVLHGEIYDYIFDSEGNHMTAADVVFSYERGCEGTVVNFDRNVKSFEAVGEYEFEITLKQPEVVGVFAKITKMGVVTQAAYEASADQMTSKPVGTGPYVLTDFTSGYSFTLEKRDDYWQTDESQRDPRTYANVDKITYYIIPEGSQRSIALENGSIDMCGQVSAEDIDTFEAADNFWVQSWLTNGVYAIQPNCGEGRLTNDVNLRLAIFYALNNEAITQSGFGRTCDTMNTLAPSNTVGYNAAWAEQDNYMTKYDPVLAKEYLDKSSYSGETLKLICQSSDAYKNVAQLVIGFLDAIGIKVEMEALDSSVFRDKLKDENAWDLQINMVQNNGTFIEQFNGEHSTARSGHDRSSNFIKDDAYQDMISTCMLSATSTQKNLDELYDHIIDNAYFYSISAVGAFYVLPSSMASTVRTHTNWVLPGGCTFTE